MNNNGTEQTLTSDEDIYLPEEFKTPYEQEDLDKFALEQYSVARHLFNNLDTGLSRLGFGRIRSGQKAEVLHREVTLPASDVSDQATTPHKIRKSWSLDLTIPDDAYKARLMRHWIVKLLQNRGNFAPFKDRKSLINTVLDQLVIDDDPDKMNKMIKDYLEEVKESEKL